MKLSVGTSYLAVVEAGQIIISETEKSDIAEQRIKFTVLEKPKSVLVKDSVSEKKITLPKHLQLDEWCFVKEVTTNNNRWLNSSQYSISELHGNK
jgi:hypothetical protein